MPIGITDVEAAAERIAGQVVTTPVIRSGPLSERFDAEIFLKLETFQFTASFKERGALNRLLALDADERRRGVVAMSAGNHAQGVARHAARLGIPATIVMPLGTPFTKVRNTERLGARVELVGGNLQEALDHALALVEREGRVFVHPFDDPLVMAGQGTLGLEFLKAVPDLDMMVVPIGGGGLISGVATAAKALRPEIEVIGVQSAAYPSMKAALEGREVAPAGMTIAEGIAVKAAGELTRRVVAALVEDILIVEEWRIEDAIDLLVEVEKVVAEGAGAAPLAALELARERIRGRRIGLVVTGGNIDPRTLSFCMMRRMVRDGRLCRLRVTAPDLPGALSRVAGVIGDARGNIQEVVHQRPFARAPVRYTEIEIVIETKDRDHKHAVMRALEEADFEVADISGDTADTARTARG
ncbi:MAG: threonine ammonia-lyase [Alphaproteobacteria bacterium]|nr:MAG: threonine ammonia-lyase [Alphaproteobacteria bacterium]